MLQKIFKFKAKHITDVENKFKLILRQMDSNATQMLGFHEKSFNFPRLRRIMGSGVEVMVYVDYFNFFWFV